MIVFSVLLVPMTEWDIHLHAQELFDAVFNYFPITFRPPPNDPYGITAQDLKDRLRFCIAASSELAPYAFPALLDKLDSTSMNTKRDVLQALKSCVENYGPNTLALHSVTMWDALKFEILQVQEEDLAQAALDTLAALAKQLSKTTSGALVAYLKPISKEANEHLEDAPTKQSKAAGSILESLSGASPASSSFMLGAVLPRLFALYESADTVAKRRGLVEVLNGLIKANLAVFGEWRAVHAQDGSRSTASNALASSSSQIFDVLLNGLGSTPAKEVSYRMAALEALTNLVKACKILGDSDISRVITSLDDIVLNEEPHGTDDVRTAAMKSLVAIAHQKPQLVINVAFPQFLAKLPETKHDEDSGYVAVLEGLAQMAKEPTVFPTVILGLNNRLNASISGDCMASPAFIRAILVAMLYAFSENPAALAGTSTSCSYFDDIVRSLIQSVTSAATVSGHPLQDERAVELVGKISNVIFRQQSADFQASVVNQVPYRLWHGGNDDNDMWTLRENVSIPEMQILLISTYLLAAFRRDVKALDATERLLPRLRSIALSADVPVHIKQTATQQVSLIVNKILAPDALPMAVDSILHEPANILSDSNLNHDKIRLAFAVAKALLLRNAPLVPTVLQEIQKALSSSAAGITVARGFSTLLQPDELLNKDNHCVVSPLHKQKLFHLVVSDITKTFLAASGPLKKNCIVALSGILRWLPYAIIEPHLPALTPLFLQMLDLVGESDIKASAIDALTVVLVRQPASLEEHAGSLISRLLTAMDAKRTDLRGENPPDVRAKALRCLTLVPARMKRELIIPYRRQVVNSWLVAALDDRRRAVRMEAVPCRKKWIELDGAGDDDD